MRDRLIQQMLKQILEPICEARFYNHSYGFRPNRSTHHAMSRCQSLINKNNLHYVVDIDIKGFFDNVNHTKLLKQMYNIGIKDKRVLAIISKMLKAPIMGIGTPQKGTPQGGIISPLLSNIVLNQLDWWIANQWEFFETRYNYEKVRIRNNTQWVERSDKYRAMRKTNLKEMFIVRYADDFKIFTKSHNLAIRIFHAVKGYLKNELKLDISDEKSKITNLKKNSSDFLGFTIKAVKKNNSHVAYTHVEKSKLNECVKKAKIYINQIKNAPTEINVQKYNSFVIGIKNYYKIATHISNDFAEIAYRLSKFLFNSMRSIGKYGIPTNPDDTYMKLNNNPNNFRTYKVAGKYLFPIADIKTKKNMNFSQDICNYTEKGRALKSKIQPNVQNELRIMMKNISSVNIEYADNRLSRYSMQNGKCAVTGLFLNAEQVHCHHIKPKAIGGTDEFKNLVIIHEIVHRLIHASDTNTIERYMKILQLNGKQLKKVNTYRKKCNLLEINC